MALTKSELIRLSNAAIFNRGEKYYREKRVRVLSKEQEIIHAQVRGNAPASYHVVLKFPPDHSKLLACRCDCPAFASRTHSICKHIVATLLAIQGEGADVSTQRSDNGAILMLNQYLQGVVDKAAESQAGQAVLEPVLEYDYARKPALFFRVGEKRMYVVQDLRLFAAHMQARSHASYGKFDLWHTPASFDDESRRVLAFFLNRYDQYNHLLNGENHHSYYGTGQSKRNMYLSPAMADEFFGMLEGKEILLRDHNKKMLSAQVIRKDFKPHLRLKKTNGGAELDFVDWYLLIRGDQSLHILADNIVYNCSEAFTTGCENLLTALNKHGKLFFADKELPLLFSTVLPQVEPFVKLETKGAFETYHPLPLETKIYLDMPKAFSITAHMTFAYGEKAAPAFVDKNVAESQDLAGEVVAENLLASYFGGEIESDGTLRIDEDPDAVYRLVTEGVEALSQIGEVYASESFGKIKVQPPASVSVGVKVQSNLLHLDFDLEGLSLSELPGILASFRARKKYHLLRDGSFMTLDGTALSGLSDLVEGLDLSEKQLVRGRVEIASSRALYLDAVCKRNEEMRVDRDRVFKQILRNMQNVEDADYKVPDILRKVLRNYQKTGYRWLKTIAACGFGGVLADDMGLGKTLQILALLQSYHDTEDAESLPSMVVCPSSLCLNWESEARKFTPALRVSVIAGTAAVREKQIAFSKDCDLLITSYDSLKRDIEQYEAVRFALVVIDEAQYIKNQATQNAKAVKSLSALHRFALTGTPVENSLAELWSVFDFLMPGYLFSYSRFKKRYEEPIVKSGEKEATERLKQLVRPFLLRRLKKDVLKELPPKTETVLHSEMDTAQKKVYAAALAHAQKELRGQIGMSDQGRMAILAALTRLRQICCDPALLSENYQGGSTKLEACMQLIESCIASGRRILLFSQFTSMLDILQEKLKSMGIDFFRIDGTVKAGSRLELVNLFNAGNTPIFLISLKAGGTGLNLTGADVVIHYDPWWNLSVQNQATDRAHRIGQKNPVQVYKLIVKGTIEERILDMQNKKAELVKTVISENANPLEQLRNEELRALLEV